jgi:hypothetical protein
MGHSIQYPEDAGETLNESSFRWKSESSSLIFLDSRLRGTDKLNDINLTCLVRYEDLESDNAEFNRRKKKALAAVSREWTEHPRTSGSFQSDPEWQKYQRDLEPV